MKPARITFDVVRLRIGRGVRHPSAVRYEATARVEAPGAEPDAYGYCARREAEGRGLDVRTAVARALRALADEIERT